MADQNHRVGLVSRENVSQRPGRTCCDALQRLSVGKANELGRGEPGRQKLGGVFAGFFIRSRLPFAVVEIVKLVERLKLNAAGACYGRSGGNASLQGAAIHYSWRPVRDDPVCQQSSLVLSKRRQSQFRTPAKALRLDAIDVAMACQKDKGHVLFPCASHLIADPASVARYEVSRTDFVSSHCSVHKVLSFRSDPSVKSPAMENLLQVDCRSQNKLVPPFCWGFTTKKPASAMWNTAPVWELPGKVTEKGIECHARMISQDGKLIRPLGQIRPMKFQ
jgi:hypothetical protein